MYVLERDSIRESKQSPKGACVLIWSIPGRSQTCKTFHVS